MGTASIGTNQTVEAAVVDCEEVVMVMLDVWQSNNNCLTAEAYNAMREGMVYWCEKTYN